MSGGGGTPKATAEEKKLAGLAQQGYEQANNLQGGKTYLMTEAVKTDRTDKYAEQSNANAAAIIDQATVNPLVTPVTDLRTIMGGASAANAQADTEQQNAGFSLANAGLGTKAITEKALYQQGMEQMQVDAAKQAAKDAKDALIPSVLGTAAGAYATTTKGRAQIKETASSLWDKITGAVQNPEEQAAPSAFFTGSASAYRK